MVGRIRVVLGWSLWEFRGIFKVAWRGGVLWGFLERLNGVVGENKGLWWFLKKIFPF